MFAQIEAPAAKEVGADFLSKFVEFNNALVREDLLPLCLLGVVLVAILIGSAAFASSIAESRYRSRNFHFLLGLLMPVFYPLAALALMSRRKFKRDEEEEEKEFISNKGAKRAADKAKANKQTDALFNEEYFKELMFDEKGSSRGPFLMHIDQTELRVERISEVLPQVVVIETVNADGKQQTMRLPFNRITGCREI